MTERTIKDLPSLTWRRLRLCWRKDEIHHRWDIDNAAVLAWLSAHRTQKQKNITLCPLHIYWMNFPISPWCENCGNGWWLHNFLRALKLQLPRTASTSNDMMPFSLHGSYKKKRNFFLCIKFFRQRASDVQHLLIHVKASSQKVGLDGGGISKRFSPKRISLLH